MATRKNTADTLKKKAQKLEQSLSKIRTQKTDLSAKEKTLLKTLKETRADYIVALMTESGKSLEELERFVQVDQPTEFQADNGGDKHV